MNEINEIISQMKTHGLDPDGLQLDGKVHRFKVAESKGVPGWYCGFMNFSQATGKEFFVCRYGNFKTGEIHQYQSDIQFTPADREKLQKDIKKAKEKADMELRLVQNESAQECEEIWAGLSVSANVPYLNKKKIEGMHGSRAEITHSGIKLFVPLRDVDGKLWSLQEINGSFKKFYPGGRIHGCMHVIGNIGADDQIIIAEGFATAASIHMATQKTVVCAFNASNMETVGQILRNRFQDKSFIIAGDDDQWTTRPGGESWNPGREAAEVTAKRTMGVAVFPKFISPEKGKTTDFNDLHVIEGIDRVREQIALARPEKHYIIPLGFDAGVYYFVSNVNSQVQALSANALGSSSGLMRLQPLEYWEGLYPGRQAETVAWTRAANELMGLCHQRGVFKPDRVRGPGVWSDQKSIVYHKGDSLVIDGEPAPLHRNRLSSTFIYETSESMPPVHNAPLTADEAQDLIAAIELIRWQSPQAFLFFAGFLAIAPIAGCLSWRPHIWLTGPSGSGKSYVMQHIVHPIFKDYAKYFRGQTSEAGIRQFTGRSTQPVIFDEFETNDEKSSERVKAILELARQASSDSDGIVAKGTVGGAALQFKPQFMMLVASVRTNLVHEEDENRFTTLDLSRAGSGTDQFKRLQEAVKKIGPEFGRKLFARSLKNARMIQEAADIFRDEIAQRLPMRIGQQYGTLLAGSWSLSNDRAPTQEEAKGIIDALDLGQMQETAERDDEIECLNHLLDHMVYGETYGTKFEATIREMIRKNQTDTPSPGFITRHTFDDALERIGIVIDHNKNVCIGRQSKEIVKIYKNSKWSGSFGKTLARITNAKPSEARNFPNVGARVRCVLVPMEAVLEK